VPGGVAPAVTAAVAATGMTLARENVLGLSLRIPGQEREGVLVLAAKRLIGVHSLGRYAAQAGIAVLTTETPWAAPDLADRVRAQVVAVHAVGRALATVPGPRPMDCRSPSPCREVFAGAALPATNGVR
jgi:hypothetical protein